MGFKLMKNFDRPYQSASIREFWQRWHISLSTWFRDYVYISLGGNKVSMPRWYFNVFIVFLLSGFWHGANWTFIAWGALHGFYMLFGAATLKVRTQLSAAIGLTKVSGLHQFVNVTATFLLVMVAWIFFRAGNLTDALYMVGQLPASFSDLFLGLAGEIPLETKSSWGMAMACVLFLEAIHLVQRRRNILSLVNGRPVYVRWMVYYALVLAIVYFGVFDNRQFIYFQF
jgi:D-alanyl-lipoteichoic acid acyltransferase DltB (MBOAT superfamily)